MKYEIINKEKLYDGFFKLEKALVSFETYSGDFLQHHFEHIVRGDAVAVILFEKETESIIFVEQFRYPVSRNEDPWLLEIVAGMVDEGEKHENAIIREIMEEAGYKIEDPEYLMNFYATPGGNSERVFLYYVEVSDLNKENKGEGIKSENEDLKIIKHSLGEIKEMLKNNVFKDAKTLIGLQWFLLNR